MVSGFDPFMPYSTPPMAPTNYLTCPLQYSTVQYWVSVKLLSDSDNTRRTLITVHAQRENMRNGVDETRDGLAPEGASLSSLCSTHCCDKRKLSVYWRFPYSSKFQMISKTRMRGLSVFSLYNTVPIVKTAPGSWSALIPVPYSILIDETLVETPSLWLF